MDNKNTPIDEQKKPDDTSGIYFSSFVKITDPETKEVLVEQRGDI